MLVICEECAKKYNIDENRIKGTRARFSCLECGHIIVVEKPQPRQADTPEDKEIATTGEQPTAHEPAVTDSTAPGTGPSAVAEETKKKASASQRRPSRAGKKSRGVPITVSLLITLTIGFLTITGVMGYLFLKYIPELMNRQADLRTKDIAISFAGSVKQPLLVRNYLLVNKEAERVSQLPGVAYAAVVNKRGIVVAGFFSDLSRFSHDFATQVEEKGFPQLIVRQNRIAPMAARKDPAVAATGREPGDPAGFPPELARQMEEKGILQVGNQPAAAIAERDHLFTLGGQRLHDKAIALPEVGGEVHVGIYMSDVDQAIKEVLLSPTTFSLLGLILFSGILTFFLIARSISKPLQELTEVVNRISLGELDLSVRPRGPREVRELASAFERMQYSIKAALERMRRAR